MRKFVGLDISLAKTAVCIFPNGCITISQKPDSRQFASRFDMRSIFCRPGPSKRIATMLEVWWR